MIHTTFYVLGRPERERGSTSPYYTSNEDPFKESQPLQVL